MQWRNFEWRDGVNALIGPRAQTRCSKDQSVDDASVTALTEWAASLFFLLLLLLLLLLLRPLARPSFSKRLRLVNIPARLSSSSTHDLFRANLLDQDVSREIPSNEVELDDVSSSPASPPVLSTWNAAKKNKQKQNKTGCLTKNWSHPIKS